MCIQQTIHNTHTRQRENQRKYIINSRIKHTKEMIDQKIVRNAYLRREDEDERFNEFIAANDRRKSYSVLCNQGIVSKSTVFSIQRCGLEKAIRNFVALMSVEDVDSSNVVRSGQFFCPLPIDYDYVKLYNSGEENYKIIIISNKFYGFI